MRPLFLGLDTWGEEIFPPASRVDEMFASVGAWGKLSRHTLAPNMFLGCCSIRLTGFLVVHGGG